MAWERRKGRFYYYRKIWLDGTCRSQYIGPSGDRAALFAGLDQLDRERRQQEAMERQIERNQFAELASTPEDLTLVLSEVRTEVARTPTAAGYHQHKRQWRKKRGTTKDSQAHDA